MSPWAKKRGIANISPLIMDGQQGNLLVIEQKWGKKKNATVTVQRQTFASSSCRDDHRRRPTF